MHHSSPLCFTMHFCYVAGLNTQSVSKTKEKHHSHNLKTHLFTSRGSLQLIKTISRELQRWSGIDYISSVILHSGFLKVYSALILCEGNCLFSDPPMTLHWELWGQDHNLWRKIMSFLHVVYLCCTNSFKVLVSCSMFTSFCK